MINEAEAFTISEAIRGDLPVPYVGDRIFIGFCERKVYSKGRPRFNMSSGHAYTPKNTRIFEKAVKEWIMESNPAVIDYPCKMIITVYDKLPKSTPKWKLDYLELELSFSTVGDLDNKAKSIADAANETLLMDDSLVSHLDVRRLYVHDYEGFKLEVQRSGFSAGEIDIIERVRRDQF